MADLKMTFTDLAFGDVPKPKETELDKKLNRLANEHLEKTLPSMVNVYNMGKSKDFSAKQANLAKYATYGSEIYGKLGFDPYKAGGIPGKKSGMDVLYDEKTPWVVDVGRAWDGMWKLAGIGFQDTVGLGSFASSGNYLDFEDVMSKYSSSRGGAAGLWSNTMLSSGYTVGIITGIAAEEVALAGVTALTGGAAAPATIAAGGTSIVRGVAKLKNAGNMLKFVNKLQDIKAANGFMGKVGASAKGFGKALLPFENTMDFVLTADKLKDVNGWKQAALGAGAIVRDARKITMSHGESKLEADMARKEFTQKMYDDFYEENPGMAGMPIPKNQADLIESEAQKLHDNVYTANFGLIYATNAITFDNMLKTMKGTNRFFSNVGDIFEVVKKEGGKVAVDVLKKNVWNYSRKKIGELSVRGVLKSTLSSSMEGFQELGQDVISESLKVYRERNVKGLQVRGGLLSYLENDLEDASKKQLSAEGASTFLSGALMGVFASPVGVVTQKTQSYLFEGGVNKSYDYFTNREKYKKEKLDAESQRKQRAKVLTEFFNNNKNFVDAWSKPIYSQSVLQEKILAAAENGDQKTMKSKQHESFVTGVQTLLASGMETQFADHLEYMAKNFDAQNLNEIFGRTDITEENKNQWQQKLQYQADNVRRLRNVYNEIENKINNPIDRKSLKLTDPDYIDKFIKYTAIENLKTELLFNHAKIADRANRQKELKDEINKENPLTTLEINALLDDSSLKQQIELLEIEVKNNATLTTYGDTAVNNQATARAKLKAYKKYQEVLNEAKAEQKKDDGSVSESDTFDKLFEAYNNLLEVSGKNNLINSGAQIQYNRQQFDKIFDYLLLGEEATFSQEVIDTVLNPVGANAFIEAQEARLKRLEENKEDHILSALYEFDKKAVSDDMLNELYENNLFFDLQELDDLINNNVMPSEIVDITTKKTATPEQHELAQKIINSYIKKLKGKNITNDKTQLNKQGRKTKNDKRTVAQILRQYKGIELNKLIKLSSPEGQNFLAKLMAKENKFLTKLDREVLEKIGEQDVSIRFVSDNTLPVQLTEDGVIEMDIRFAGTDYANSVMSFENLITTGLTQHAITEKLKTNDDMWLAARNAMEQAKKAFKKANPRANVEELNIFDDVNLFMTEAMNDMQFQKFLAQIEDTVQPTSKSLWSTLSSGIAVIVEEDFDKKLANRVINIAAKALDDSIIDNISESNEASREVTAERQAASKEKVEELKKLATDLGKRWNVNVQVLSSQDEADKILNNIQDPFYQRFSTILNDLLYGPSGAGIINLRKGPVDVSLQELLKSVYEKSNSLTELISNLKELSIYQTNGKIGSMVDWLVTNADSIGDGLEVIKNIFFQADNEEIAGFYDEKTNTAYIVADAVKENTLYHEIFLHPFLINLEKTNPQFYKQLVTEARNSQEIIDYVEKNYGTEDKIGSRQFEHELVGRAYDLSVSNKLSEKKEPGLFKTIGQFIKKMFSKISELFNISKSDVSRFNPRKTTISDLADYSVNSEAKVNLGKIIEAEIQSRPTAETVKPRTRKKTVTSVRTIIQNAPNPKVAELQAAVEEVNAKIAELTLQKNKSAVSKKPTNTEETNIIFKEYEEAQKVLLFSKNKYPGEFMPVYQYLRMLNNRVPEIGQDAYYINRDNTTNPVVEYLGVITKIENDSITYLDPNDPFKIPTKVDIDSKTFEFENPYYLFSTPGVIDNLLVGTTIQDTIPYSFVERFIKDRFDFKLKNAAGAQIETSNAVTILDDGFFGQTADSGEGFQSSNDDLNRNYGTADLATTRLFKDAEGNKVDEFNSLPVYTPANATGQYRIKVKKHGNKKLVSIHFQTFGVNSDRSGGHSGILIEVPISENIDSDFIDQFIPVIEKFKKDNFSIQNGKLRPINKFDSFVKPDFSLVAQAINKQSNAETEALDKEIETLVKEAMALEDELILTDPEIAQEVEVEEQIEVEEEIPAEEIEPANETEAEFSYQSRTEILGDLKSVKSEIEKLETEYDKVTERINNGKLSLMEKRKAKNKQNLLAIDINDLYQQLNTLQAGLSKLGEEGETLNKDAQYVPIYDYNNNEIITDETPWMNIPKDLRIELAAIFGKDLNKINETDIAAIRKEIKVNPLYISAISAFSNARLNKQDADLGSKELLANKQKIEEAKVRLKQQQEKNKLAARQAKKDNRVARKNASDEDILKAVLKDFDYSILTSKEISQLVSKLKDKSNALVDFTVNDIIAYINNKKIKQAEKEQKLKDLEAQKEQNRINNQIKSNLDLLRLPVIPFKTNYGKEINMRIPQKGMRTFITVYYPEIFALPRQEFLDAVNMILKNRISEIKAVKAKDFGFEKGSKTTHLKLYSLFRKLEKEKKLYPEVVNKINLALYNADSKFRIRATRSGKDATMSSMYVIQKVKSTKRITPPGIFGKYKKIITDYEINLKAPSVTDIQAAIIIYFMQGGKVRPGALSNFKEGSTERKDWANIVSEDADSRTNTVDGASEKILQRQSFDTTTTGIDSEIIKNALGTFFQNYSSLSQAIKEVGLAIEKNDTTNVEPVIDDIEAKERDFLQDQKDAGMTQEEAEAYLVYLKFFQTEEGQEALNAEAEFLNEYYGSKEFELLNDEFYDDENNLSDTEFELKELGSEEEEVLDEGEEVQVENEVPSITLEPIVRTEADEYFDELESLAAIPMAYAKENALQYAWDNFNGDKKSDPLWAAAMYRLVNYGKFKFSVKQIDSVEKTIRGKISDGAYINKTVKIGDKIYRIASYMKRKVVVQNLNDLSEFVNLELDDFLRGLEKQFPVGSEINNLNIDSVVKVKEFDYIKGAYSDILNNFTTYMGEANSLSEDKLLSKLKEETTKCK
jgi:hypothetical protein